MQVEGLEASSLGALSAWSPHWTAVKSLMVVDPDLTDPRSPLLHRLPSYHASPVSTPILDTKLTVGLSGAVAQKVIKSVEEVEMATVPLYPGTLTVRVQHAVSMPDALL